MWLELIRPPTIDVVTLEEARRQCHVVTNEYDEEIEAYIKAAQGLMETWSRQCLATTHYRQGLNCFPACGEIALYAPPLQSVTSVKYIDAAGAEVTWDAANYGVDTASKPGRIVRGYGVAWPEVRREGAVSPITIEFIAGYASAEEVPAELRNGMKLLIGWWFRQREAVNVGNIVNEVPLGMKSLAMSKFAGTYP